MTEFRAAKRLKNTHRRESRKTPLRSYARSLALTPAHELHTMPPNRISLVYAARDWLAHKGASTIRQAA